MRSSFRAARAGVDTGSVAGGMGERAGRWRTAAVVAARGGAGDGAVVAGRRAAPTASLAKRLFQDETAVVLVRQLVQRSRRKLGGSVIENTWGGYRIPGRFRPVVPTRCARCGSPVEWDARDWWCADCGAGGEMPRLEVVSHGVGRRGYAEGTRQGQPWSEEEGVCAGAPGRHEPERAG